jgi:hypothetical protein
MTFTQRFAHVFVPMTLAVFTLPAPGAEIRVPQDQPTIQAGIDAAAEGDMVLVAPGTYTGPGNRDVDFNGKAITVRSEEGPETCLIDCEADPFYSQNHLGFYFQNWEGRDSLLEGFTITGGYTDVGGAIDCRFASPTIRGNVIAGNWGEMAGAINIVNGAPLIENNLIRNNSGYFHGAVRCGDTAAEIAGNLICDNEGSFGGGIACIAGSPLIEGNRVLDNEAPKVDSYYGPIGGFGGGLCSWGSDPQIVNNLFSGNWAEEGGGALALFEDGSLTVTSCTISGNEAGTGGGIYLYDFAEPGGSSVTGAILWGNVPDEIGTGSTVPEPAVTYSLVQGGYAGQGNLDQDPLFVVGPRGDCYLSQQAAGQPVDSPAVDAADPSGEAPQGTTRTDGAPDGGIPDMGYHYRYPAPLSGLFLVLGPGPGETNPPLVRLFTPAAHAAYELQFEAYAVPRFGVNTAGADLDGDGADELLSGPGPGEMYGPHVRGWDVDGGLAVPLPGVSFLAYGTRRYGVNVTAGDLDGDGYDEIVTGAGPGAVFGPHVRGWNHDGGPSVQPMAGVSFLAYGTNKWGVNVAAGDLDGDGYDEIVTGAGPGPVYGPHVRGWNVDGGSASPIPGLSFLAYGTNRYGVNVTAGDVDGDGVSEIITGPGPSPAFSAHIRGWDWDGSTLTPLPGIDFQCFGKLYGARVFAGPDLDGDGRAEIVVGGGPNPDPTGQSHVWVYGYDGTVVNDLYMIDPFPGLTHGTTLAAARF